jgi:hypothetical protein
LPILLIDSQNQQPSHNRYHQWCGNQEGQHQPVPFRRFKSAVRAEASTSWKVILALGAFHAISLDRLVYAIPHILSLLRKMERAAAGPRTLS